jgi:hypothetical protein
MNYIFGTHFRGTNTQSSCLRVFKEKIRRLYGTPLKTLAEQG